MKIKKQSINKEYTYDELLNLDLQDKDRIYVMTDKNSGYKSSYRWAKLVYRDYDSDPILSKCPIRFKLEKDDEDYIY